MFPRIFCALLISHGLLAAQEPVQTEAPASDEPAITDTGNGAAPAGPLQDVAATARTFIPSSLGVPLFTPPPPPVVKRLPAVRVDAAVTLLSKNARTLTLQRGEASTAPDLPPPPPPPPYVEPHQHTPEEIAQHIWQQRHNLNLGATIFDHKISLVNWIDQQSQVHYEAVCGFDIGLLAGVGGFVHNGEDYSIFLVHAAFDTSSVRHFASQWFPNIPEVAPGEILITRGDVKDIAATAPMTVIKEIIAAETPRLLPYQAARTTYFAASAAWNAAHPPIPRDETFVFRPHRGSRYLPATEGGKP